MPYNSNKLAPNNVKIMPGRRPNLKSIILAAKKQEWVSLLVVTAVGSWLRLYGLFWDRPEFFNPDESRLLEWGRAFDYLNPLTSEWGALPLLAVKLMAAGVALFAEPGEENLYPLARGVAVLTDCATILLVYLLARRSYNRLTALYATIFTVFTVLLIQDAHFYSLDGIFGLLVVVALFPILAVAQAGQSKNYGWAGLIIGLAAATRINGYLLLLSLLAAHYHYLLRHSTNHYRPVNLIIKPLFSPKLWLAAGVSLTTFILLTPAALLDTYNYLFYDGLVWVLLQTAGYLKARYTLQFEDTTPAYYFTNVLFWSAGPFLLLAYLAGVARGLFKWRHAANLVILAFVLVYLWTGASARVKFIRYGLPLLPLLNILAAAFFVAIHQKLSRPALKHGLIAWLGLTVAGTGLYALAFTGIYARPDTRILAARWIQENIPAGAVVVRESGDYPSLMVFENEHLPQYRLREINFDRLYRSSQLAQESRPPALIETWNIEVSRRGKQEFILPANFTPMSDAEKWAHIWQELFCADYIVFTERNYALYRHRAELFPVEQRYYRQLFSGELGFQPVQSFTRKPQLLGWQIEDDEAELTFRLFDHPSVWVFQSQLSPDFVTRHPPPFLVEANWDNKIRLVGYNLQPNIVQPGQNIQLRLYWAALTHMPTDYTVFVHVLDSGGLMAAQSDHQVGDGLLPTSCWQPGRVIVDQLTLPVNSETAPGYYQLKVGLYSANTLARLTLLNDTGGENAYPLAQIQVGQ